LAKGKKILAKLEQNPKCLLDWGELCALMAYLGYTKKDARGGGAGTKFINSETKKYLACHRPHPGSQVCAGARDAVVEHLRDIGVI